MAKRRDYRKDLRLSSNGFTMGQQKPQRKLRNLSLMVDNYSIKSKYIPDGTQKDHQYKQADLTDFKKQKLFNRNISYFRQSFNQNDSSQLPFMSSLRKHSRAYFSTQRREETMMQPFEAADKTTANLLVRKNISDLFGNTKRMSVAYYGWHNKSGVGSKQATNFEVTLRDYNKTKEPNPEQQNFDITIKPMRYQDVQAKKYSKDELVCPRQRKLFPII